MYYFLHYTPDLERSLQLTGIKISGIEYLRCSVVNSLFVGICIGLSFFLFSVRLEVSETTKFFGSLAFGVATFLLYFFYLITYPGWVLFKKSQQIDESLVFAMRHLSVQVSAGVPLFDAIHSASEGYGSVSEEFKRIITFVNGGKSVPDAIDESASSSSSRYYQRIMWQLSNSARSGYAIKDILKELVEFLTHHQRSLLKKFGSELNVLSIFYLSTSIIFPTLGLIFVIISSSIGEYLIDGLYK